MSTNIVVCKYQKDCSFAYKINNNQNVNVIIYDKENPEDIPVNKGLEHHVYLKYMIDHYDTLSDFTFFIHDNEYAWHHTGSLVDRYQEAVQSNKKYYNVNNTYVQSFNDVLIECTQRGWKEDLITFYKQFIEPFVPLNKLNLHQKNRQAGQFLVHKSLIRKIPKQTYEDLYNWIIQTDYEDAKSSRFLEWTWHILLETYEPPSNQQ
jgi:hypothetical protein